MKRILSALVVAGTLAFQFASAQVSFDSSVLIANLKFLSSDAMEGRKTGTPGIEKARAFIIDQLKKNGIDPFVPEYTQSFSVPQISGMVQPGAGVNILGVIPGNKKETIVISAHYDHLGIRNDLIYNGTDDNASGTAALLSVIQYFKKHKPEHRLIIAFFDSEEMGLRGSAHFVNSLDLLKEKIVLNVNLDMVSRSEKHEVYASGTHHNPILKTILGKVKTPDGMVFLFGHDEPTMNRNDWTNQSDHYNFHQKKIPFIYFGVEDHPDYHRPTDDFEKIDRGFYSKSVEAIIRAITVLDSESSFAKN